MSGDDVMRDAASGSSQVAPEGFDSWNAYWTALGMAWRTEPEIGEERRAYLAARRAVPPDIENGIYPFRDENGGITLTREDVEWLLASHESHGVHGPVEWADVSQRGRKGIDLRGADLRGAFLRNLPLSRTIGGWLLDEEPNATPNQLECAAVHLEGADFRGGFERQTHLEGGRFTGAHLENANLYRARLERVGLDYAFLQGSDLSRAHLEFASLAQARLEGVSFVAAHLEGVNLSGARLGGADGFPPADMRRVFLDSATTLDGALLADAKVGAIQLAGTH